MPTQIAERPVVTLEAIPNLLELSRRSGLSHSQLSRIFSPNADEQRWPGEKSARALAEALRITVPQVYDLVEMIRRRKAREAGAGATPAAVGAG